jgi:hypothetical protein
MIDFLIRFFTYNKIYLLTGLPLLLLIVIPSKEKVSSATKKAAYVFAVIWIICFAYRINTGNDITHVFNKSSNDYSDFDDETPSSQIKKGPFSKYYSNDAGRKSKE